MEQVVNLSTKHGEKGVIRLRLLFHPMIIAKTRKNTSTFSTAGRAMTTIGTTIGSIPLTAGLGVFHGVTGVFKHKEHEEIVAELPSGQSSQPMVVPNSHVTVVHPPSMNGQPSEAAVGGPGTLRVAVLGAKGLSPHDIRPYTTIRVGDKEVKTKHTGKTDTPEWLVMLYLWFNS